MVLAAAIPLMVVSQMFEMSLAVRMLLAGISVAVIVTAIGVACVLDREAGAFECPGCHARFVPEMGAYLMGPHTLMKRKLKCPDCGRVSYCRHVLMK